MPFNFCRPIYQVNYSNHLLLNRYAPKSLENMAGQSQVIQSLIKYRDSQNLPNMIITGPPGTGKKTAADLLVKSFLGEFQHSDHLAIDGSVSRGKHVITENASKQKHSNDPNIINFIKARSSLPPGKFKIITITDFDHMTNEAQMALRRLIEIHSNRVRFIFLANDYNNIIEALQSRCVIIKFNLLTPEEIRPVLDWINQQEQIRRQTDNLISSELIEVIILMAYGDLKQALNYLQVILNVSEPDVDIFYDIFGLPQLPKIQKLLDNVSHTKNSALAYQDLQDLLDDGYTAQDLLDILYKVLMINTYKLSTRKQHQYLQAVARTAYLTEQTGTDHHLYAMIADFKETQ